MKKIISLILCLCFILSLFAGCGSKEDAEKTPSASEEATVESIAADGKLDGVKFGLGAAISEVKNHYETLASEYEANHNPDEDENHLITDEESYYYNFKEKDGYNIIDVSSARFYYKSGKEDKGVSVIASDSDVFGFKVGITSKYEIEEEIKAKGKSFSATEEELRFLAVRTEPVLVLRYEFDDYNLDFYFFDNTLITTVITDTNNWKL